MWEARETAGAARGAEAAGDVRPPLSRQPGSRGCLTGNAVRGQSCNQPGAASMRERPYYILEILMIPLVLADEPRQMVSDGLRWGKGQWRLRFVAKNIFKS